MTSNATDKFQWNSGFVTNPAPLLLQNGSIAIVYKAKPLDQGNNSGSTMYHGVAMASDYDKPYVTINNVEPFDIPHFRADEFLWSSNNDSVFHILFQAHWNCSQQIMYSNDLLNWDYYDMQPWCSVNLTNGTDVGLLRRERPALLFDDKGEIEYLFTAVQPESGRTFNLAQKIGT